MRFLSSDHPNDPDIWDCQTQTCEINSNFSKIDHLKKETQKTYKFDYIYSASESTKDIYELFIKEKVLSTLEGQPACIFAYGGSKTGKSMTLFGPKMA